MREDSVSHRIVSELLRARTGQELTPARLWRVSSALSGILRARGIDNLDQLVCLLADPRSGSLATEVVEALINNETYFFRDGQLFEELVQRVLPTLAERRSETRRLSIWSAGCSSGQELLSLAMIFRENPEAWAGWRIRLVGTDVSGSIIARAKAGIYSQFEVQRGLTVARMLQYFEEKPDGWWVDPQLLQGIDFQCRNLLDDAPPAPGTFDLILCRNVLLYFDSATRDRIFARLHGALAHDGRLMLGAGETAVGHTGLFEPARDGTALFRPVSAGDSGNRLLNPASAA